MTHEEIKEDLSLYVLGTLDEGEHREVQVHLKGGCLDCERELIEWREVVALLGQVDEEIESPDLKANLIERIESRAARAPRPRVLDWRVVVPLAAAAVFALVGTLREFQWRSRVDDQINRADRLVGELENSRDLAGGLREQLTAERSSVESITAQLAAKEADVTQLRAALAEAEEFLGVLQAPGLRLVRLQKTRDAKPAEGHVLLNSERGRAIFYGFDLPPVDADKTYELWWITEKKGPINAGLFRPDERGLSRVESQLPTDAGAIKAAAVTIEPAAGVEKPTGPMVLLGDVRRG